jgi:hypothetical protein
LKKASRPRDGVIWFPVTWRPFRMSLLRLATQISSYSSIFTRINEDILIPMKRRTVITMILAIAVLSLFIGYLFLQPPPKLEPLPDPNGYDDFVAAGQMMSGEPPDFKTATVAEGRAFLSANKAGLERGRLGLTRQCRVPVEYSDAWEQLHITQVVAIERLVLGFRIAGELAQLEHRPADAASNYLVAVKIGVRVIHGGDIIDSMDGMACEGVGEEHLMKLIPELDAQQSRYVIHELQQVQAERDSWDQIVDDENRWALARRKGITALPMYVIAKIEGRSTRERISRRYANQLQWTSQLIAKLATRAYTLEKGQPPPRWSDLVPSYLESVPNVPFSPGDTNQLILPYIHPDK